MAVANGGRSVYFLDAVHTGETSHTAQFLAGVIDERAAEFVERSVELTGVTTDNAAANMAAFRIIEAQHPKLFLQGCCCHCGHLLCKDVCRGKAVDADDGCDSPFPDVVAFIPDLKLIAQVFHNQHIAKARLERKQAAAGKVHLAMAPDHRWGGIYDLASSALESEALLHEVVTARDWLEGTRGEALQKRRAVADIINGDGFVRLLRKSVAVLAPLKEFIRSFESDTTPLSDVFRLWSELPGRYDSLLEARMPLVSLREVSRMKLLIRERWNCFYADSHGIANMLDPVYIGEHVRPGIDRDEEEETYEKIEAAICEFPPGSDATADELANRMAELLAWRRTAIRHKESQSRRFVYRFLY